MTTTTRDANGQRVTRSVKRNADGTWGRTVWAGRNNVTTVRRYHYDTRQHALAGDISDDIGRYGRVS